MTIINDLLLEVSGVVGGKIITTQVETASGETLQVTVEVSNANDVARLEGLRVNELAPESDAYLAAYDAVAAAKWAEDENFDKWDFGFFAADIELLDANGEAFEPEGTVDVKFELISLPAAESTLVSSMEVQHLVEKDDGTVDVETVATSDDVMKVDDVITAEFSVDAFSTYTLTWDGDGSSSGVPEDEAKATLNIKDGDDTYATVIVHYVDVFGHNITSPINASVDGQTPVVIDGLLNSQIEGYEYQAAYYDAYSGEETDQAIGSITVTRTDSQTTGTEYVNLGTASGGRINSSTTRPTGYTEFYSDANGTTPIYWITGISGRQNNRFHTRQTNLGDGTRYSGTVYGARQATITNYDYVLTFDNDEIEALTNSNTTGTWQNAADIYLVYRSTDSNLQAATIHWGTFDGEDFVELKTPVSLDTNASTVNLKINMGPDVVTTSQGEQGEDGWYYVGAEYRAPGADKQNLSSTILRKNNDVWQVRLEGQTQWTNIENGSHIYVNYAPMGSGGYTPPDRPGADVLAPETKKKVTPNEDGTFTIRLDVVGKEDETTTQIGANVIIVMDITQSMTSAMPDGSGSRMAAAKRALSTLVTTLNPDENLINFTAVNFGVSQNGATVARDWTTRTSDMNAYVTSLPNNPNDYGTNWKAGLQGGIGRVENAAASSTLNKNETYVLFVTDGNPNCYTDENGGWHGSTGPNFDLNSYNAAVPYANTLGRTSHFYGIFVGDADGYEHLEDLVTGARGAGVVDGSTTSAVEEAFEQIAQTIVENLGAGSVSVDDGVPTLATVAAAVTTGEARNFEYLITPKDGTETTWTDAPGASYSNSNGVTWDLSQAGTLKDGWTYTLQFDVWPSQAAYDLIADLNNGVVDFDDLTDEQQDSVEGNKVDGYTMKTNTHLFTTFKDLDGNEYRDVLDPQGKDMALPTETITVTKVWNNPVDSHIGDDSGQGVELYLTKDGKNYLYGDDAIVVAPENPGDLVWESTREIYISCGFITQDPETHEYVVHESGHDYEIAEPPEFAYYWDLHGDVYHPMVINGVAHYLILDDDADGDDGIGYYEINGHKYVFSDSGDHVLTATNDRRSSLNVFKEIDDQSEDQSADAETLFEYTITVNNCYEDVYFDAWADGDYQTIEGTGNKEIKDGVWTGWYYAEASDAGVTNFTINVKEGWSVYFANLPKGATYTIQETNLTDGWAFESATSKGEIYINPDQTVEETYTVNINPESATVSGEIEESNHLYTVTLTNKWEPTGVELTVEKEWESGNLVTAHSNVTVALFKDLNADETITADDYIDGSVRNIEAPDFAPVTYTKLSSLDGIVVREVVVTTEGTGDDAVTTVTPIDPSGRIVISGETPTIGTDGNAYVVTYTPGTEANNTRTDTVTNTLSRKDVTVTKVFSGVDARPTDFKIANDYNSTEFNVGNKVSGTGTSAEPYTWTIQNVPEGTTVIFTESGVEGITGYTWDSTSSTALEQRLTVAETGENKVEYENIYTRDTGSLKITKATVPAEIADDQNFKVSVKNSAGQYLQDTENKTFGAEEKWFNVSVDSPLTITDLPTDTYTVTEDTTQTDVTGYRYNLSASIVSGTGIVTKGGTGEVPITNNYTKLVDATVKKVLVDNFAVAGTSFSFKATLKENNVDVTETYLGDDAQFTLTPVLVDGEWTASKTFTDLPSGAVLSVMEDPTTVTYIVTKNPLGDLTLGDDSELNIITVTNTRVLGNLKITKQALFNNAAISEADDKDYTVTVRFEDGRYVSKAEDGKLSLITVNEGGTAPKLTVKPSEALELNDLPLGVYTVVEDTTGTITVEGETVNVVDIVGYRYDNTEYSPTNGEATVTTTEPATVDITNKYTKLATVTVIKNVVGLDSDETATYSFSSTNLADGDGTFTLIGSDDTTTTDVIENKTVFPDILYGTVISITETGVTIGEQSGSLDEYDTTIEATCEGIEGQIQGFPKDKATATGTITVAGNTTVTFTNTRKQQYVQLLKTGIDDTVKLSGATFEIYSVDKGFDPATSYADQPETKIDAFGPTDVNGYSIQMSLANGVYYLVETQAPAGYNKLTGMIMLTVSSTNVTATIGGSDQGVDVSGPDANGVFTIKVQNSPGVSLPHTGGIGTTVFTAGGISLIALALFLLMKKRMALHD